jgi:hypothetical protein
MCLLTATLPCHSEQSRAREMLKCQTDGSEPPPSARNSRPIHAGSPRTPNFVSVTARCDFFGAPAGNQMGTVLQHPRRLSRDPLGSRADLCAGALTEARRLVAARVNGPFLSRLLTRAWEALDEIDEILIGLNPVLDHDVFARVAALHRELTEIQSLVPRNSRLPPLRS